MIKKALISTSNLMFRSKLSLIMQSLDLEAVSLITKANLKEVIDQHSPVIVVFDLSRNSIDSVNYISELRGSGIGFAGAILCFGPHVATELLASAKRAGADQVIPNSVLAARGEKVIRKLLDIA